MNIDIEIPSGWTTAQWERCQSVCKHQGVRFIPDEWEMHHLEGYIMNREMINGMYIGIEPDGYAHT